MQPAASLLNRPSESGIRAVREREPSYSPTTSFIEHETDAPRIATPLC